MPRAPRSAARQSWARGDTALRTASPRAYTAVHQQAVVPSSEPWAGWRGGQRGTWWGSTRARAGSCAWGGTTPGTSAGWGWPAGEQLCGEGLGVLGDDRVTTSQQRALAA